MDREEVAITLARIEAKLDILTPLPERVSKLELWQSRIGGGIAVIVGMGAVLVAAFKGWLSAHGP